MLLCECGRPFKSADALEQHKRAGDSKSSSATCSRPHKGLGGLKVAKTKDRWIFKNTTTNVGTIDIISLEYSETAVSSRKSPELLCSYSWVQCKKPTIYVPGQAPEFVNATLPLKIRKDFGVHYIDQNRSRVPRYPFEVVFRATAVMNPRFHFSTVDIVTNRNSLRKLLDLCYGRNKDSFRLNTHVLQNTLILERCEKHAKQLISGSNPSGYGHNFERRLTQTPEGMENSVGHHRVLKYQLGSLAIAVCFEIDALQPSPSKASQRLDTSFGASQESSSGLDDSLASLRIDSSAPMSNPCEHESLTLLHRGVIRNQSHAAELKSGTNFKSLTKFMPQLWFGRTPYLVEGRHKNGVFKEIRVTDIGHEFETWEAEDSNQSALRQLTTLLSEIRRIVKTTPNHTASVVFQRCKPGILEFFLPKVIRRPLPNDIIEKHWELDKA